MTLEPVSSPIDMEAFENAVHAWFTDAMEIQVIWAGQAKVMPEYPVGVLQIIAGPIAAAPSFELRTDTNLARGAGTEVEMLSCVPCTFTVSCQVWVGGDDRWHPSANARYYLMRALAGLSTPSYQAEFLDADISVVRNGPIQDIGAVQEDAFVSKANMDVIFGAVLNSIEYTGYIKTTEIAGTFTGTSKEIDGTFGDI